MQPATMFTSEYVTMMILMITLQGMRCTWGAEYQWYNGCLYCQYCTTDLKQSKCFIETTRLIKRLSKNMTITWATNNVMSSRVVTPRRHCLFPQSSGSLVSPVTITNINWHNRVWLFQGQGKRLCFPCRLRIDSYKCPRSNPTRLHSID